MYTYKQAYSLWNVYKINISFFEHSRTFKIQMCPLKHNRVRGVLPRGTVSDGCLLFSRFTRNTCASQSLFQKPIIAPPPRTQVRLVPRLGYSTQYTSYSFYTAVYTRTATRSVHTRVLRSINTQCSSAAAIVIILYIYIVANSSATLYTAAVDSGSGKYIKHAVSVSFRPKPGRRSHDQISRSSSNRYIYYYYY